MTRAVLGLLLFALLAGGCASSRRSTDITPAGLRLAPDQAFDIRVTAKHPEHEEYAAELRALIAAELVAAGFSHSPDGMDLHSHITYFAPGGAWGEEADCRMDITLKGETTWRFSVVGGSGSQMARDRIPLALRQAAQAVAERIVMHR